MGSVDPAAIAAFLLIGIISPLLGYAAHLMIGRHKTRQAIRFLEEDPLVFEGSRFRKILTADGGQLMGPGLIESIEPGRLVAISTDGSVRVPFDAVEFKSVYPHWLGAASAPAPDAGRPGSREEAYS